MALRVWPYAAHTSLWLDEILLTRNILDLPMADLLTRPLGLDQVAPRGFLPVEKTAVLLLGPNEWALRLFPMLCAVFGVFLFRRLAERTLDGLAATLALMLFAIGTPFIRYSAEVKQYEGDATAAIALMLLALMLRERDNPTRRLLLIGLAGLGIVWFSQTAVLVMAGLGLALVVEGLITRDGRSLRTILIPMSMWAAAAVVAVLAGMQSMTPSTREFMDDFWRRGFLPLPLTSVTDLRWFWDQALSGFTAPDLLRYRWPQLFIGVALVGVSALWRVRREVSLVLLGPFVVALIAAAAHQYPFHRRLMVYLIPGLLLAVAAGGEWIRRRAAGLHPALGGALLAVFLFPPVAALVETPPPYEIEHHRTMLRYLQQHRRAGDSIYVFPLQRIGVLFYGPEYGLQPNEWSTAACDRNDARPYIRDLDRYRGAPRVWVLTSGSRPFTAARAAVQQYLAAIGVKRDSLSRPSLTQGGVSLELYDLSDTARLGAANAESFPVLPMPTDPRPGCRPFVRPGNPPGSH